MTPLDFTTLYRDYRPAIFGFIARRVRVPGATLELAEDMTQEVFRKAFEAWRGGATVTQPGAWLFRIARNLVVDYYRSKARHLTTVHLDDAWDEPSREPSPHEYATSTIGCEEIERGLNCLEPLHADVIRMLAAGYASVELGPATGRSMGAGKQVLVRARQRLRHVLTMRHYEGARP